MREIKTPKYKTKGLIFLLISAVSFGLIALLFILFGGEGINMTEEVPLIALLVYALIFPGFYFFFKGLMSLIYGLMRPKEKTVYIDGKKIKKVFGLNVTSQSNEAAAIYDELKIILSEQKFEPLAGFQDTFYFGREIVIISYNCEYNDPDGLFFRVDLVEKLNLEKKSAILAGAPRILNIHIMDNSNDIAVQQIPQWKDRFRSFLGDKAVFSSCLYDISEQVVYYDGTLKNTERKTTYGQSLAFLNNTIFSLTGNKSLTQRSNEKVINKRIEKSKNIPEKQMYKLRPHDWILYFLSTFGFFTFLLLYGIVLLGILSGGVDDIGQQAERELIVFGCLFVLPALLCLFFSLKLHKTFIISKDGIIYKKLFGKKKIIPYPQLKCAVRLMKNAGGILHPVYVFYDDYLLEENEIIIKKKDFVLAEKCPHNEEILKRMVVQLTK